MSAAPVLLAIIGTLLWLLRYRFKDNFFRAYALFFLVLLVYASNKEYYGISPAMSEGNFSPLSLVRWGCLMLFVWQSWKMTRPANFTGDTRLLAVIVLLVLDMMLSSIYADSVSYSFMRAVSFGLLTFAVIKGTGFYLFSSVNCLQFFRFKYYVAWIVLAPLLLMLLSGIGYGVTIIMGQYAGYFGNQNMFGTFSALITPYVLFHWRIVASKTWQKWVDLGLIGLIFIGLYYSGSRNGLVSCVLAGSVYYAVINLKSRIRLIAAGICLVLAFVISPTLQSDLTRFVRKGTDKSSYVTDFSSQVTEEKRFEMWTGVWPLFWKQKLTGYGFASSHLLVFEFTADEEAGRSLHNSYLEIFGDLGLPGLILLMVLLFLIVMKALTLIQYEGEPLEQNIKAVFIAIFVAGSANAFFESWMFSVGNLTSLMYWVPVAGVVARWAFRPESVREAPVAAVPGRMRYPAVRIQN